MKTSKGTFKLSLASLILGILNSGLNLPWAAVILLWGGTDPHGGLGLASGVPAMDFFGSASFFMSFTGAALILLILSVVFLIRIRKRNPGAREKGMAAAGLVLNILGMVSNALFFSVWVQFGGA